MKHHRMTLLMHWRLYFFAMICQGSRGTTPCYSLSNTLLLKFLFFPSCSFNVGSRLCFNTNTDSLALIGFPNFASKTPGLRSTSKSARRNLLLIFLGNIWRDSFFLGSDHGGRNQDNDMTIRCVISCCGVHYTPPLPLLFPSVPESVDARG